MTDLPANLPPLPPGTIYAGRLMDHTDRERICAHVFGNGDKHWTGFASWETNVGQDDCWNWHVAIPAEAVRDDPAGKCHCQDCNLDAWWMIVCPKCGNKRCPHASHHLNDCAGSNAPDQPMEHQARPINRLANSMKTPASPTPITDAAETDISGAGVTVHTKYVQAKVARALELDRAALREALQFYVAHMKLGYNITDLGGVAESALAESAKLFPRHEAR